jgi:hypothetical protein
MDKKAIGYIGMFVFVVIICGWIGVGVDSVLPAQPEGNSLGMGIWLILPLLTAFIIIFISKLSWNDIGFNPNLKGNLKWYLASILIFPVVTTTVLLIGAAANWIDLSAFHFKPIMGTFFGALLANCIINFFEETAWRGYLTSQLLKFNLSDWKLYFIIACVWAAWHIPYYLVFLPEADIKAVMPVSRAVYILVAFTTFLCWTVMFTELYRITRSIWPCIILHTVEDSLINFIVISGYISITAGKEFLVSPINGIIASLLYLAVGLGLRAYRLRDNQVINSQNNDNQPNLCSAI